MKLSCAVAAARRNRGQIEASQEVLILLGKAGTEEEVRQ